MRDDELRRLLALSNPWWKSATNPIDRLAWTDTHRLLVARGAFDLGYRADVLNDIASKAVDDSLIVLNGPRRIGKSVAIIDTIAAMCARDDIDPRQLIHVPCDGMRDRDLRRVITLGRALTESIDADGVRRRVWFFDEISDTPSWTTVIKQARDLSGFGDDTVIATGSRWAGTEDIYGNLMAGRAGTGGRRRIRQLLPMTFREFMAATTPQLPRPPAVHPADLQSANARQALAELAFLVDDYDLAWQNYLTSGGFPRAVAEYTKTGGVSDSFSQDLLGWLRTDIDPESPRESVPLLLAEISQRTATPLNLRHLAETLDYVSRSSLNRRISRMVNSHAALRCHQVNAEGRAVAGAQYKLYLVDPILAWTPANVSPGLPEPDFTKLTESVLGVALARCIDNLDEGRWADEDTVGYSRTTSGTEIDLAPVRVPTPSGPTMTTPIESKWVDTGWLSEARTISRKYGKGILATKSILDLDHDVWAVPAPLVALLLA